MEEIPEGTDDYTGFETAQKPAAAILTSQRLPTSQQAPNLAHLAPPKIQLQTAQIESAPQTGRGRSGQHQTRTTQDRRQKRSDHPEHPVPERASRHLPTLQASRLGHEGSRRGPGRVPNKGRLRVANPKSRRTGATTELRIPP